MNTQARKVVETIDEQGGVERKVETMELRSSAGQGLEERTVDIIHQYNPQSTSRTSGGVLTGAAAAVASTLQSAKDAISKK